MSVPAKKVNLRLVTPQAILSYPRLFVPEAGPDGGDPKYSATFIITAEEQQTPAYAALLAAIPAAAMKKFGAAGPAKLKSGALHSPIHSDEDEVKEKGYPKGSVFFSARSKEKPGLVNAMLEPITEDEQEVGGANEVYAGCIVKASVTAFGYDNVSKGVSFALNNVQLLRGGARLDNRVAASDEFEADLSEVPQSLEDMQ